MLERAQGTLRACHDRHSEPVPPILRPPADPTATPPPASGGSITSIRPGAAIFRIWNNEIVQWKVGKPQPEEEGYDPLGDNDKPIRSMGVKIAVREVEETAADAAVGEIPNMVDAYKK